MEVKTFGHGGALLAEKVREAYRLGQVDYSMEPLVRCMADGKAYGRIESNDAVIFCCRRGEREIELTDAFVDPQFPFFARPDLQDLYFVILTLYHEKFKDLPVAFAPAKVEQSLAEVIAAAGLKQFHCAESEKFAHVTFFFNGGNNHPFDGEDDVRIPSPRGIPFDQVPQLSLPEVTKQVVTGLEKEYDFIVTNFANGDVIGHTASTEAKIQCAAHVDTALGTVVEAALRHDYVVLVTADHGNLEVLYTPDGKPHVAHTTNLVPFILIDSQAKGPVDLREGKLCDIAPTILHYLNLQAPQCMDGQCLVADQNQEKGQRVMLVILDGWGDAPWDENNPIYLADTPNWDRLLQKYPHTLLQASGEAVGLKAGKAGNSEAGHLNLGAGRVILQDDVRLDMAMQDGSFYSNEIFVQSIDHVKQRQSKLHLIALLTEKSSHGSIDYPLAILKIAKSHGLEDVFIHVIFDGRSTEPGSAPALLEKLEGAIDDIGIGQIVSGVGRGIALDRDGNYNKIEKAYQALVLGRGQTYFERAD